MIRNALRQIAPKLAYSLPDAAWLKYAQEETRYTPDVARLEEHGLQLYFACDETQKGHLKYDLVGENTYKCPGFTQKSFNYWDCEIPFSPPVPMEATGFHNAMPNYPDIAKIKGQILLIRPEALLKLDEYKENGVQYRREKARILIPYRALNYLHDVHKLPDDCAQVLSSKLYLTVEKMHVIRAWMYVGIPEYWDKLISAFDYRSVQTFEAKNRTWCRTYYQYRRPVK